MIYSFFPFGKISFHFLSIPLLEKKKKQWNFLFRFFLTLAKNLIKLLTENKQHTHQAGGVWVIAPQVHSFLIMRKQLYKLRPGDLAEFCSEKNTGDSPNISRIGKDLDTTEGIKTSCGHMDLREGLLIQTQVAQRVCIFTDELGSVENLWSIQTQRLRCWRERNKRKWKGNWSRSRKTIC